MAFTADKVRQGVQQAAAVVRSIDNSLRFNDDDSAYLSRTPSSAGNRKTWTWSGWVKRGNIVGAGDGQKLFAVGANGSAYFEIMFYDFANTDQYGIIVLSEDSTPKAQLKTTAKYRDPSSWYHVMLAVDTTQSTSTDRLKLYVNGSQITDFNGTATYPSLNFDYRINAAQEHNIGRHPRDGGAYYLDGYLAEVHFIDGQALAPTSFGKTGTYGEWEPIEVTGMTYGTNGFYLDFSNSGTKHTLTANGNAQHSTAQSKIGASSIYLDGSGDSVDNTANDAGSSFDFGSAGDFTLECWARPSALSSAKAIMDIRGNHGDYIEVYFNGSSIGIDGTNVSISGSSSFSTNTWYHIAVVRSGGTVTIYKDGVSIGTDTTTGQIGGTDYSVVFGRYRATGGATGEYYNGYLDEIRISNTARYTTTFTPSTTAFTEDANTLLLIHSDTTNGSTTFTDDSGVVGGLGKDASSNTNNWTVNNLAATDQMLDTPTNNFATGNPLITRVTYGWATLSEGNLQHTNAGLSSSWGGLLPTMLPSTGKYYAEVYCQGNRDGVIGVINFGTFGLDHFLVQNPHFQTGFWGFYTDNSQGVRYDNGNNTTNDSNVTDFMRDKVMGIAIDNDNSKLFIYKNNTVIATINNLDISNTAATDAFAFISETANSTARTFNWNFGQDSSFAGKKTAQGNQDSNSIGDFYYTPPTGFLALCTQNLPDPAVIPSEHFNTVTWAGNDTSQSIAVGFQPDWNWTKTRNYTNWHILTDSLRGATKELYSNDTGIENTDVNGLTAFTSTGYNVGSANHFNNLNDLYVAWNWKANGAGVSNTNGTITSTVSANADAGFSIVSYVGDGSGGATVGHGLSKAPEMVIIKNRDTGDWWDVYTETVGNDKKINFNSTTAAVATGAFNSTSPTSTVFSVRYVSGSVHGANNLNTDIIAYCFHSVDGYSKVGSYTGNGSTDGTFVYTGFRPAYVIVKDTTAVNPGHWQINDNTRSPSNVSDDALFANGSWADAADDSRYEMDFLSNGIKIRTTDGNTNNSGNTYIYLAFAEVDFKHSNAR